jgi:hypothetical protein
MNGRRTDSICSRWWQHIERQWRYQRELGELSAGVAFTAVRHRRLTEPVGQAKVCFVLVEQDQAGVSAAPAGRRLHGRSPLP